MQSSKSPGSAVLKKRFTKKIEVKSVVHLEPSQTSRMESFSKNSQQF